MINAIVFDCFGVLAEDGWSPFKHQYLGDPEKALAVAKIGKEVDAGLRAYDDMIRETALIAGVDEAIVRAAVGHKVPNEQLFVFIREQLKPYFKIGLLSNASYNVLKHLFTPEQVALFDATALSYEAGLVKPHTDMFHLIAQRLGEQPESCLLVDDQQRHIDGAHAAGMQAIQYESLSQGIAALQSVVLQGGGHEL